MGACGSCQEESTERAKNERRQQVHRSESILVWITHTEDGTREHFQAWGMETVGELLARVCLEKYKMTERFGGALELVFADEVIAHGETLSHASIGSDAEIEVRGFKALVHSVDIHKAASEGDLETVQLVCAHAPNRVNERKKIPVLLANCTWEQHVCEFQQTTPLIAAASGYASSKGENQQQASRRFEMVNELLRAGALVNMTGINSTGQSAETALMVAVAGGYVQLVECLVKAKADVRAQTGKNGRSALTYCQMYRAELGRETFEKMKQLLMRS